MQAGDPGDSMFIVSEGSLDVIIATSKGPVIVAQLWPGDCLGEMSLFTGEPRSAQVRTREASVTFEVRKQTMAAIFKRNPSLALRIAETMQARHQSNADARGRVEPSAGAAPSTPRLLASIRRFFQLRSQV